MLVLSRHRDESIIIGDNIEIMIVDIRRNQIQLGIIAPKVVPVYRKEIYGRICREKTLEKSERIPVNSRRRDAVPVEV